MQLSSEEWISAADTVSWISWRFLIGCCIMFALLALARLPSEGQMITGFSLMLHSFIAMRLIALFCRVLGILLEDS